MLSLVCALVPLSFLSIKTGFYVEGVSVQGIKSYITVFVMYLFGAVAQLKCGVNISVKKAVITDMKFYIWFGCFCCLSTIWSISIYYSLRYLVFLLYPIIMYHLFLRVRTLKNILKLVNICFYLILAVSLINLIIETDGAFWRTSERFEGSGLFDISSSDFFMVSTHFICLYVFYHYFHWLRTKKLMHLAMSALLFSLVLLNWSRTYIAALVFAIVSVTLLAGGNKARVLVIALCLGGAYAVIMTDNPLKRKHFYSAEATTGMSLAEGARAVVDSSIVRSGRLNIISHYVKELHERRSVWLGGGINTVRYIMDCDSLPVDEKYPHSSHFRFLAEIGIAGGLLYACLGLYLCAMGYRLVRSVGCEERKKYGCIFLAFTLYWLVGGFTYEIFQPVGYLEFLYLYLALARRSVAQTEERRIGSLPGIS